MSGMISLILAVALVGSVEATPKALQLKDIAIAQYQDQFQEKSFQTFLDALEEVQLSKDDEISKEEKAVYEEALELYLHHSRLSPQETARQIQTKYQAILESHPDYYALGYIIAAAYANLGRFTEFYQRFYLSYLHLPDHFMAYKGKAALHLKLFERAISSENKDKQRDVVINELEKANERYSKDTGIYKLILIFTNDQDKSKRTPQLLNKIIDENIVIPRADILFYVREAVAVNDFGLAQRFLAKAKEWHQYSRAIETAENYIVEHHGEAAVR